MWRRSPLESAKPELVERLPFFFPATKEKQGFDRPDLEGGWIT
jgi:hypothetical protein